MIESLEGSHTLLDLRHHSVNETTWLVASVSIRKTKLAKMGMSDDCKLLGKTILLATHAKITDVISIDVWVKKPRVKVNVPTADMHLRTFNNKDV